MVDAVLNQGLPAPIDMQLSGSNIDAVYTAAASVAADIRKLPGVSDVFIPQDIDYPSLRLDIDRERAAAARPQPARSRRQRHHRAHLEPDDRAELLGRSEERQRLHAHGAVSGERVRNLLDLRGIPLHGERVKDPTLLDAVTKVTPIYSPTEIDHYQIRRVIDIYVNPAGEDLGTLASGIDAILADARCRRACASTCAAWCRAWRRRSAASPSGLILALVLLYLILVAQFRSFIDPLLILLAVPTGLTGVLVALYRHRHDAERAVADGRADDGRHGRLQQHPDRRVHAPAARTTGCRVLDAVVNSCRIRLRPILMTSLATIIGLRADGAEARHRQRGVRAAGARHHRRPDGLGRADRVHRAGRLPDRLPARGAQPEERRDDGSRLVRTRRRARGSGRVGHAARRTPPPRSALKDAEKRALADHPQIRAAQYAALAAGEVVREAKSAYFPTRLRQRHRRGGAQTARASPPAA